MVEANFHHSTFEAEANFEWSTFQNACECEFNGLRLGKDAQITFEKVNLKRASFLNTNLEGINFRDVDWYRPNSKLSFLFRRKHALWDESLGRGARARL